MSLTAGLSIAKSALANFSLETAVVSRNIASAGDDGYVRRDANIVSQIGGGTRFVSFGRAADRALLTELCEKLLANPVIAAYQKARLARLKKRFAKKRERVISRRIEAEKAEVISKRAAAE